MIRPVGIRNVNGKLTINNHSFEDLRNEYKTPLYIIDEKQLNKNIKAYEDNFKSSMFETKVVYASKALLNYEIVRIMDNHNFYLDAVSIGDLYIINNVLHSLKHVVFHGNNKSYDELVYAVENGIGFIVIDNIPELKMLDEITNKLGKYVEILVRVNPHIDTHTHKFIQTSKVASKFGISISDKDAYDDVMRITKRNSNLKWVGLHAHIGSNIFEESSFEKEINVMVNFLNKMNNSYHIALSTLNIGGGIGVKYNRKDPNIKLEEFVRVIISYLEDSICKTNSLIRNVMIEPGRSIVGNAGVTLYTISQVKSSGLKNYIMIDGGMNDNIRCALYNAKYVADIVNKPNDLKVLLADVVGKCCESGDIIIEDGLFPKPEPNDLLIVYTTGAYNYSMSSNYNSLLRPAMVLVGDEVKEIVKREDLSDLTKNFK